MNIWRLRVFDHTSGEMTIDAIDEIFGTTPQVVIREGVDRFDRYDDLWVIIAELTEDPDGGIVERQDYTYQLEPIEVIES